MTGFGQAILQDKQVKVSVQIRSVNHRHADIHLRVPKLYLSLEDELREQTRMRVHRGRTDVFVDRTPLKGRGYRLEVDDTLMEQYCDALQRIKKRFRLEGEIDLGLVPRLPDLFQFKEPDHVEGSEKNLVLRALEAALKEHGKRVGQARPEPGRFNQSSWRWRKPGFSVTAGATDPPR